MRSLSFRIAVILMAGFVLLQVIYVVTLALPGRLDDRGGYGLPSPPAFAQLVRSIEAAGPQGGRQLVETFDGSLFAVEIRDRAPSDVREMPASLRPLAIAYRGALPDHDIVVDGGPALLHQLLGDRVRPLRFLAPIRLTIWLRDGEVLVLTGRPADGLRAYLARRGRIGLIGGIVLLAVLLLALRQTTGPLRRLTQRVRALGEDLTAPDLRPEGSREVRALALAFNDMKARVATLVAERTFMLAGIAHDLRTFLTRLRLRAEFIADEAQRDRTVRDLNQMAALIDDSLLFAGLHQHARTHAQPLDLATLTRRLAEHHPASARIALDLHGDATVDADPAALERIFANLVDNALRHAGTVTIGIDRAGQHVAWTFADDGPGVPPADLPRLGTAFVRLDPSRDRRTGGSGLGLAIVRALVDAIGGTVMFRSPPDKGLVVDIALPRG